MVGDFMVCVDRIIASACLDSGNNGGALAAAAEGGVEEGSSESRNGGQNNKKSRRGGGGGGGGMEVMECRICQEEEEEEGDLESPCACNGTLKFAHRKCIQRWCNKKGDITCEICNQVYAPNYSIPPNRASSDVMAIDIRQSWGTPLDLHDPRYLAFAAAEQELLRQEYEDYAAANSSGVACCRSVALILMLLLLVRHILMITRDSGLVQDASAFFNVSLLQFAGFLLPCYVIARSCYIIQSRRRRQV